MRKHTFKIMRLIVGGVLLSIIYSLIFVVPSNFPEGEIFEVKSGESIVTISNNLKDQNYVKSPFLMRVWMSLLRKDTKIAAGLYTFDKPADLVDVVNKFSSGKFDIPAVSVTIPEGFTAEEIAERISYKLKIDKKEFLQLANRNEGYLFPNTYFFLPDADATDVIALMRKEFNKQVGPIAQNQLILASIVQAEANNPDDMRIVAGVLIERLSIGMPLQVDVATTTYEIYGIPNVALNNPGLDAINAVRNPAKTSYLYYISGDDGSMYYAKTFNEHKRNIVKHLK